MLLVSDVHIVHRAFDPNFLVLFHIGLNRITGRDEFSISIWKIGFVFNLYSYIGSKFLFLHWPL